jgi:hypothetical protein
VEEAAGDGEAQTRVSTRGVEVGWEGGVGDQGVASGVVGGRGESGRGSVVGRVVVGVFRSWVWELARGEVEVEAGVEASLRVTRVFDGCWGCG